MQALNHLAFLDLNHFDTETGMHYDPMHTIANTVRDLFKLITSGARVTPAVLRWVASVYGI